MARKRTMNYRELRADFDEDEVRTDEEEGDEDEDEDEDDDGEEEEEAPAGGDADAGEDGEDGDDEDAPKKKKKAKPKAKVVKPKRARVAKVTRMRVVWGVFNNSNQKVATYDYPQRDEADSHAKRLTEDKKSTHFVQPVKEPIEEVKEKDK